VPVVKDKLGDLSSVANYRPITLIPIISKIFEYCILHKYEHLFCSEDLQFGFKKNCEGDKYRRGIKISRFSTSKSLYLADDTR